jgi:hypothetical protein
VARDDTFKLPFGNSLGVLGHCTAEGRDKKSVHEWGRRAEYIRLVLALAPDEILVELVVGLELLGEEAGLALLGLGVLFGGGQVEDQVGDNEGLGWLVIPGDILLAEPREVDSVDLFGAVESEARSYPCLEPRILTSFSKPKLFLESGL